MKGYLYLFGALLLLASACNRQPGYSTEIAELANLLDRLDSAEQVFAQVDRTAGIELSKQINADVDKIAASFTGDMSRETASLVSQYKSTGNIVKNWGKRHSRVVREIERTRKQMSDLKKALETDATHDADGNAFTPEYVQKVYQQETTVAEHLIEEIGDMQERLDRAQATFSKFKPSIDQVIDQIAAEEE